MVTLKADNRGRVKLPGVKPGEVFALESYNGKFTLMPLKKAELRTVYAKLVRKGGRLIFELPKGYTIPEGAIGQALREEREAQGDRGYRP